MKQKIDPLVKAKAIKMATAILNTMQVRLAESELPIVVIHNRRVAHGLLAKSIATIMMGVKDSVLKDVKATIVEKVEYVRKNKKDTTPHHCHWPGCEAHCPPAQWGCRKHWFMLPKHLRDKVWAAYRPGQEITKTPSREYVKIAREVQNWIKENHDVE